MTFKEVVDSGKRFKRMTPNFGSAFGKLSAEPSDHVMFEYMADGGNVVAMPLNANDILAEDWETERLARTFWLGLTMIQSHDKQVKVMRAVEGEAKPEFHTSDRQEWIKVTEVL